jgi:hypothetical protein
MTICHTYFESHTHKKETKNHWAQWGGKKERVKEGINMIKVLYMYA